MRTLRPDPEPDRGHPENAWPRKAETRRTSEPPRTRARDQATLSTLSQDGRSGSAVAGATAEPMAHSCGMAPATRCNRSLEGVAGRIIAFAHPREVRLWSRSVCGPVPRPASKAGPPAAPGCSPYRQKASCPPDTRTSGNAGRHPSAAVERCRLGSRGRLSEVSGTTQPGPRLSREVRRRPGRCQGQPTSPKGLALRHGSSRYPWPGGHTHRSPAGTQARVGVQSPYESWNAMSHLPPSSSRADLHRRHQGPMCQRHRKPTCGRCQVQRLVRLRARPAA